MRTYIPDYDPFSTTILRPKFTVIIMQLTNGGESPSHGDPDDAPDLVELAPDVQAGKLTKHSSKVAPFRIFH